MALTAINFDVETLKSEMSLKIVFKPIDTKFYFSFFNVGGGDKEASVVRLRTFLYKHCQFFRS